MVTRQLQVERRTGKVRRPHNTDVLSTAVPRNQPGVAALTAKWKSEDFCSFDWQCSWLFNSAEIPAVSIASCID